MYHKQINTAKIINVLINKDNNIINRDLDIQRLLSRCFLLGISYMKRDSKEVILKHIKKNVSHKINSYDTATINLFLNSFNYGIVRRTKFKENRETYLINYRRAGSKKRAVIYDSYGW